MAKEATATVSVTGQQKHVGHNSFMALMLLLYAVLLVDFECLADPVFMF